MQGKFVVGYFCSNKNFKKKWEGPRPRKAKQFPWDGEDGLLVDAEDVPMEGGKVPSWLVEITEVVNEGISRKSHIARDRLVGDTDAMDKIWDAAKDISKVSRMKKGRASKHEKAPCLLGIGYPDAPDLDHYTGQGSK